MECQKIRNSLNNRPNQPSKFRSKNMVEINGGACGTYNTNSQIKFNTVNLVKLHNYRDAYILVQEAITNTWRPSASDEAGN